jgi:hypothetical protein
MNVHKVCIRKETGREETEEAIYYRLFFFSSPFQCVVVKGERVEELGGPCGGSLGVPRGGLGGG